MTLKKILATLLAAVGLFSTPEAKAITVIGSGDDISYAVIQADAFGSPLVFAYHYTYNSADPFDSYFLFSAIDAALPELDFSWINYGDVDDPNWFLTAITYQATTLTSTSWPDIGPYWVQWVAGGESGYPEAEPIAAEVWTYGSGMSIPYRLVQPGSWDGVIFNDGLVAPISPVPEPSSALLLVVGGAAIWYRNRKKCRAQASV